MINVWRLTSFHLGDQKDAALAIMKQSGILALGWGRIGDLHKVAPVSQESIYELLKSEYQKDKIANYTKGSEALYDFYEVMKVDDLVIVRGADDVFVAEVVGEYSWNNVSLDVRGNDYFHRRRVDITELDASKVEARAKMKPAPKDGLLRKPLIRIGELDSTTGLSR